MFLLYFLHSDPLKQNYNTGLAALRHQSDCFREFLSIPRAVIRKAHRVSVSFHDPVVAVGGKIGKALPHAVRPTDLDRGGGRAKAKIRA